MGTPQYKSRDYLLTETILMLRKLIEDGITTSIDSSSGIALETTLISVNDNLTELVSFENKLERYAISRSDDTSTSEYYGFTDTSGNWYIMKIDTTTGIYTYINGTSNFLTNWGNRATLTYVEFETLTW